MQFLNLLLVLASTASATIIIGSQNRNDGSVRNLAWNKGDDACAGKLLSVSPTNPCGHQFSVGGVDGLTLEGCGGGLWINRNGQYYATCTANDNYSKVCNSGTVYKHYECN